MLVDIFLTYIKIDVCWTITNWMTKMFLYKIDIFIEI